MIVVLSVYVQLVRLKWLQMYIKPKSGMMTRELARLGQVLIEGVDTPQQYFQQ